MEHAMISSARQVDEQVQGGCYHSSDILQQSWSHDLMISFEQLKRQVSHGLSKVEPVSKQEAESTAAASYYRTDIMDWTE